MVEGRAGRARRSARADGRLSNSSSKSYRRAAGALPDSGPFSHRRASQQKAAAGCRTPSPRGRSRGARVGLVAPREPMAGLVIPHRKAIGVLPGLFLTADPSPIGGHRSKRRQRAAALQALADSRVSPLGTPGGWPNSARRKFLAGYRLARSDEPVPLARPLPRFRFARALLPPNFSK